VYNIGTTIRVKTPAKASPNIMVTAMEANRGSLKSGSIPKMVVAEAMVTGRKRLTEESIMA
jgi:hypothetical protein